MYREWTASIPLIVVEDLNGFSLDLSIMGKGDFIIKSEIGYRNNTLDKIVFGETKWNSHIKEIC